MATKPQQVAEVVEGLGLGLLASGVSRLSSAKLDLEFAFSHAWRRWMFADQYPSIGRAPKPDNEFWIGVRKSERRTSATIVWRNTGQDYELSHGLDGWTMEEVADLIASRPLAQWIELATLFHRHLEGDR